MIKMDIMKHMEKLINVRMENIVANLHKDRRHLVRKFVEISEFYLEADMMGQHHLNGDW